MMTKSTWERKKLTELAEYINGYAFAPEDWGREGLPIIRIEQLKNPTAPTDYFAGKLPEKNVINDGDLVFSWSASLFLSIWKNGKAALNQHLFKVIEKPKVDREFLKSFIEFHLPELTKASHGSTMQHITRKELEKFSALFPSNEDEQKGIALVVATLNSAIAQTEALIAKQQRIKTGLMQDLLTKGIDEQGNIRSEVTHAFKDSPLGRIPVEWEVKQLGEVATQLTSGSRGWARYYSNEGAIFLRIGNLTREHINLRLDDLVFVHLSDSCEGKRTSVCKGDLLISITADLGIIGVIPTGFGEAYVNQHIALVRLNQDVVYPRFVGHLLNGAAGVQQIDKLNESGAKAGLNLPTVGRLHIVVPKVSEQERISELLDTIDSQIEYEKANLNKLWHQKAGLMYDLLTGRNSVTPLLSQAVQQ